MIAKFLKHKMCQVKSDIFHLAGYLLNDPSTPDLSLKMPLPNVGFLKYAVKDLQPEPKNSNDFRALNCQLIVGNCINQIQKHLKSPVKNWAATNLLNVIPAAGADMNAYYDRRSLSFFYYNYGGKNTYFSDSADIVTHELGHAFLDAMRPDFWSVQSLEIWSFHEAFSDIVALFNLMSYDIALELVMKQTSGDLSKSNTISRLAEEVGVLIKNVTADETYLPNALRDPAVENFKYVNPTSLPGDAPNNKLAAECHSFGRVFSNAWYNMFVRIYNREVKLGKNQLDSIRFARDEAFSIMLQAIAASPRTPNYFNSIARSMVLVASSKDPEIAKITREVFEEWNIIDNSVSALSHTNWKAAVRGLTRRDYAHKGKDFSVLCLKNNKTVKLRDLPIVSGLSLNGDIEIEVPSDTYLELDKNGEIMYEIRPNQEQLVLSASSCLMSIGNSIGKKKMWNIESNRLVRRFIS